MRVVYERCAGLDVHKKTVVACVLTSTAKGTATQEVRTFGTMTRDLEALGAWLIAAGVEQVALGPRLEGEDRGEEVKAGLGEAVLVPVGVGAVAHALEQAVLHQRGEARGEDVTTDAEVALKIAVPVHAEERLSQDQERPAVPEHLERALHSVRVGACAGLVHLEKLVRRLPMDRLAY